MLQPASFDWRDDNEAIHVAEHGVPFAIAAAVFADPRRIETEDLRPNKYNERRWNIVGLVDGIHVNVTATMDGNVATIISARSAHRKERKAYDVR